MAIIQKAITLRGSKGEENVMAIFDSGATYSCIEPGLAKRLGMIELLPEAMDATPVPCIRDFGTAKEGEKLTASEAIRLNFYLNGYRFSDEFMLVPGLSEPAIIGAATMQKWRMKLDFVQDDVIIDPRVTKLRLL